MIDYQPLLSALAEGGKQRASLAAWAAQLPEQIAAGLNPERWGDLPDWQSCLAALPTLASQDWECAEQVRIGRPQDISLEQQQQLKDALMGLHPWRKGPYEIFGIHIDTEWRSDWKWERLRKHISSLQKRWVLDVGCGNGYHCWRMLGAGAAQVIGIDPSPRFVHQFYALKHFTGAAPIDVLPLGIEALPPGLGAFDTVFSMGVLYHRRSPLDHLLELKDCLRTGGELVLETLVVEGPRGYSLVPQGRYAKMRNVWFIPSVATLESWLIKCGYKNIRVVDQNQTQPSEQRATPWMRFESLVDFLNPDNLNLTQEGHPAPLRAILLAQR